MVDNKSERETARYFGAFIARRRGRCVNLPHRPVTARNLCAISPTLSPFAAAIDAPILGG
jgi:hypothetical protein